MTGPRVLFLTTSFPSDESPAAGIFVLEHARAAAPHAEIAVLHLDRRHDARGITVHRDEKSEFPTWRARYPYRPTALSAFAHIAAGVLGYRAVRRAGFDPDLLHAHFFLSALPAALLPRPLVATEQWTIFLPEDPGVLTPALRLSARAALRRARMVMPVSESIAAAMRRAGIRGPFRVIPNAVDTSLFTPGPGGGGARLVTVGLLGPQKGIDVLLRALAQLRERRRDVHLDIVGDGPGLADYEALTSQLGLTEAVAFRGLLPKEKIAGILAGSDLFVLASRFDNNPCVLVEAQAAGLPIVSTRVGGIPEIVDGFGALVERDDPEALAGRIAEVLAGIEGFDRAAIATRARERYSTEKVGRELAEVYRSVAEGR
jgi:glycosyltransferase involved in cell wall biosynthesis